MPENKSATLDPIEFPVLPRGEVPQWVMIARVGFWGGHESGVEEVTGSHLEGALSYFERHYRAHGTELPVDYHHASILVAQGRIQKAPAAGWIQQLELRNDGTELWGRVMWTAEAAGTIAARQFRYVSPVLRFNAPDRITGDPVPMYIHSVALTNTPFLTELAALNETAVADGGAQPGRPNRLDIVKGGESMGLLNVIAAALDRQAEQVASGLGLDGAADDGLVAEAVMANAAKLKELEAKLSAQPVVNEAIAGMLGIEPGSEQTAVKARIMALTAPCAGLAAVRKKLGLPGDADEQAILNKVQKLQAEQRDGEAQRLVDEAVQAGQIPPAQRDFFLRCARQDLAATQLCLNSLSPFMTAAPRRRPTAQHGRELSEGERRVCRQLGLSAEAFLREATEQP